MTIQVNIHEAKSRLSELLVAAGQGAEVIIAKSGKPVARIVPIDEDAERQARIVAIKAWMGSGAGLFPPEAGDAFLGPTFSDEEMDAFEAQSEF